MAARIQRRNHAWLTTSLPYRRRILELLLTMLPSNVKTEFSAHITNAENIEATAERAAHVRLTIEPSRRHHHPDWPGTTRQFEADAVIACDGVKSVLRKSIGAHGLDGATGQVRYTGTYAYRGLLPVEDAVRLNGEGAKLTTMWFAPSKVRSLSTFHSIPSHASVVSTALSEHPHRAGHRSERGCICVRPVQG
jgi:2-polyprenyl-6-methoxyphenol hydroxylase-like FAD-dependent oxidoreductase